MAPHEMYAIIQQAFYFGMRTLVDLHAKDQRLARPLADRVDELKRSQLFRQRSTLFVRQQANTATLRAVVEHLGLLIPDTAEPDYAAILVDHYWSALTDWPISDNPQLDVVLVERHPGLVALPSELERLLAEHHS